MAFIHVDDKELARMKQTVRSAAEIVEAAAAVVNAYHGLKGGTLTYDLQGALNHLSLLFEAAAAGKNRDGSS